MSHAALHSSIPVWSPRHELPDNKIISTRGSIRVRPQDAGSPEFLEYLKVRDAFDIIAEGDSWFYLPRPGISDLIEALEAISSFDHDILNFAYHGHTLDMMAFGYQDEDGYPYPAGFDQVIKAVTLNKPKAFLLSAGGNDIVGPEFKMLLNHKKSGRPALRKAVLDYIIHDYIKKTYLDCASRVWTASPSTKIFLHGYANSFPSGEGYLFLGPWLKPSLDVKMFGYSEGHVIIKDLMEQFSQMLTSVAGTNPKFVQVDYRDVVGNDPDDWFDELHLTSTALKAAGKHLAKAIEDNI